MKARYLLDTNILSEPVKPDPSPAHQALVRGSSDDWPVHIEQRTRITH